MGLGPNHTVRTLLLLFVVVVVLGGGVGGWGECKFDVLHINIKYSTSFSLYY